MQSVVVQLVVLCCAFLSVVSARAQFESATLPMKPEVITTPTHNHTFNFGYSGGAPFCTQCGSPGAYACSNQPHWVATQTFRDRHPNSAVLAVTAILTGSFACTSPVPATTIAVSLNGVIIDVVSVDGNKLCKCNTCDGSVTLSKSTPIGWPIYSYDGSAVNNVTVNVYTGSICLNSLNLVVTYGTPTYPLMTAYRIVNWPTDSTENNGICGRTSFAYYSGTINFSDFLPGNSILYSLDVQLFGVYFRTSSSTCTNATVTTALNSFQIGDTMTLTYPRQYSSNVVTSPCHSYGCDGKWLFSMAQLYQNGVPNYAYGSTNTLTFNGASTTRMAYAALWLYYLPKSSAHLVLN